MKPELPLHVKFDDGTEHVLETIEEIETTLEFFDTDNGGNSAVVFDNKGRRIRLKVDNLNLLLCEIM